MIKQQCFAPTPTHPQGLGKIIFQVVREACFPSRGGGAAHARAAGLAEARRVDPGPVPALSVAREKSASVALGRPRCSLCRAVACAAAPDSEGNRASRGLTRSPSRAGPSNSRAGSHFDSDG